MKLSEIGGPGGTGNTQPTRTTLRITTIGDGLVRGGTDAGDSLRSLRINHNGDIGERGLRALVEAPAIGRLHVLDVRGIRVGRAGKALRARFGDALVR